MKMNGRVEVQIHTFSTLATKGGERSASHLGHFTPGEKGPPYQSDRTLGGFQNQSTDTMEMRKSSYPCWK
jgi:hypothetical protein